MILPEQWIWLPIGEHPNAQHTRYSRFDTVTPGNFTVAEFKREYRFERSVCSMQFICSADTDFQLYCNGACIATGPASVGGDFIGNDRPRPEFYKMQSECFPDAPTLNLYARVRMMPVRLCEYSKGHGGFMFSALVCFEDGTKTVIATDATWSARKNEAYTAPDVYDARISSRAYASAACIDDIWRAEIAPIPMRTETEIRPISNAKVSLAPQEEREWDAVFDRIYAGYVHIEVQATGELCADIACRELDEPGAPERLIFTHDDAYRSVLMHSVGTIHLKVKNASSSPATLTVTFIATHYPVDTVAQIETDDAEMNAVLDVCRHTLKICRQLHHLDSPRHCEPLACTGDYYIDTLMTAFSFGDMTLAEFDTRRTAKLLRNNDGRMFHTTYSLIWVKMLYDVYMFTGHTDLLRDCMDAMILLLKRFEGYIGENGLIETPPDYMFVDWIYVDGISMHHPPKALGQTCLNMFYFGALDAAAKIYTELHEDAMASACEAKKAELRRAINTQLYDKERGLYFEGLNTATPEHLIGRYMPQNVEKRYYMKHSNILALYFGVCDREDEVPLLDRVMLDDTLGSIQPYFAHYLLEAIERTGSRERYTVRVLEEWKRHALACTKGLVEGFVKPEPTYRFDHSHAWGGTPLYSLPKALLGLRIDRAGLREVTLSPSLLSFGEAKVELPTPLGMIRVEMRRGEDVSISHPDGIVVHLSEAR